MLGTVLDIGDTSVNGTEGNSMGSEGNSSDWEESGSKWGNEQATELRNSGEIGVGEHPDVLVKVDLPEIGVFLCKTQWWKRISHERTGVKSCHNMRNEWQVRKSCGEWVWCV